MYQRLFVCVLMLGCMLQCYAKKRVSSEVPPAHTKLINTTLKRYQKEWNKLIRSNDSTKIGGLVKVFFEKDSEVVQVAYLIPDNLKPADNLVSLMQKPLLKPSESFKLAQMLYKGNGTLELDRDETTITSLDSTSREEALVSTYRVRVPVTFTGSVGNLSVEKEDTLQFFFRVFNDTKRKVKFALITHILSKTTLMPPVPVAPTPFIDWSVDKKIKTVLDKLASIDSTTTETQLIAIEEQMKDFLTAAAFFKVEDTKGNVKQYNLTGLLHFLQKNHPLLKLKKSTLNLFDSFRLQSNKKWYCRTTVYHDVERFDDKTPIPAKVTAVGRVLMAQQAPTKQESYWMIYSLTLGIIEDKTKAQ